jgi:hypothetical protein
MIDLFGEPVLSALIGLLGGVLLGLAARLGRFCTLGAIEDVLYGGSDIRLRMWGIAIAIAILGTFGLSALGLFAEADSLYLGQRWLPMASVVGGLLFGYGMALAGNCGFGALARLGGGDLRSFVIVLVMGITAFVVLNGPIGPLRVALFPTEPVITGPVPGIAHRLSALSGLSVPLIGIALGTLLLAISAASRPLWRKPAQVLWAGAVGVAIITGWAGTSWLATTGFAATPVASHSFSAPLGDAILWWMTGSARPVNFAVGSVAGVWTGAFIGSLIKGHFRWEACEDPRELRRQILGAGLMGTGAVIATGCTIGQGITAFSVLAYSAPVTFGAIFAGAALGLRQLITGFQPAE